MSVAMYLLKESDEQCLKWWAHDLNDESLFQIIRRKARQSVFWRCPKCGAVFEEKVCYMVDPYGPNCPSCSIKRKEEKNLEWEHYKNTPISSVPELLAAWDDERDPTKTMVIPISSTGSYDDIVFRFRCVKGHHPRIAPYTFLKRGCPYCNSITNMNPGKGYIADEWPELAAEWDSNNNGKYTPYNTRHNSKRLINWKCIACGNEWIESPKDRTRSYSACCPNCGKILGSLGWKYPEIAKEWDPNNEKTVWQVRKQTRFTPGWVCTNNPDHKWKTNIINRINGAGCPMCAEPLKSRTELLYFEAAKKVFEEVYSGVSITDPAWAHSWVVDIYVKTEKERVVIEYDGAYWHSSKISQDKMKSTELLNAGFWVFRLREVGLPALDINNPKYCEITVNPVSAKCDGIMEAIKGVLQV